MHFTKSIYELKATLTHSYSHRSTTLYLPSHSSLRALHRYLATLFVTYEPGHYYFEIENKRYSDPLLEWDNLVTYNDARLTIERALLKADELIYHCLIMEKKNVSHATISVELIETTKPQSHNIVPIHLNHAIVPLVSIHKRQLVA